MQRVAIGRALINDPRIILADEPTGNLDSATSEMIFELFRELNRQGMTLVVVTHNLDLARQAEKMYTLRDGRIVGCEEMACLQGMEVRRRCGQGKIQSPSMDLHGTAPQMAAQPQTATISSIESPYRNGLFKWTIDQHPMLISAIPEPIATITHYIIRLIL